jgi:NAD(P)-dependent dehydrogenase (short-subunit alcohol dehydrogenase family)
MGIPGMSVYGATKAALNLLTKSWAAEYGASGVRVNAVSPGPTRTPAVEFMGEVLDQIAAQAPLQHVARPSEIADAIVYLAGTEATFITGTTLNVDGGRTAV